LWRALVARHCCKPPPAGRRHHRWPATGITDGATTARSQTFGYTAANRLSSAAQTGAGGYGSRGWTYDGVGNRTAETTTPVGGSAVTDTYAYTTTNNRITSITRGASTVRAFTYDGAGNLLTDNSLGGNKTYTYNRRNRLSQATVGALIYDYQYNAQEQLAVRTQASPAATTHFIHDIFGNVIAETAGGGATGASGTVREYIKLPEAEIAPTMGSRAAIDRPMATVEAVNTVAAVLQFVHVDHLHRPVKMTNSAKATVWDAVWQPFGGLHSLTGTGTLTARLPGQWFQAETGLHYNWHRSYDPTLGRYTQPDPLGFVDGPSVYGYAGGSPQRWVDKDGRLAGVVIKILGRYIIVPISRELARRVIKALSRPVSFPTPGDEPPAPPEPPQDEEGCERWDCRKASDPELRRLNIDPHSYKTGHQAIPNSKFDICFCKNGEIVIRRTGQCGSSGPTIETFDKRKG